MLPPPSESHPRPQNALPVIRLPAKLLTHALFAQFQFMRPPLKDGRGPTPACAEEHLPLPHSTTLGPGKGRICSETMLVSRMTNRSHFRRNEAIFAWINGGTRSSTPARCAHLARMALTWSSWHGGLVIECCSQDVSVFFFHGATILSNPDEETISSRSLLLKSVRTLAEYSIRLA